jgi:hypothetical protein
VSVYTAQTGPIARELADAGIHVATDLASIDGPPDIVHGHHTLETIAVLDQFPHARGVFVCHDRTSPYAIPPSMARIGRFVAVDLNCLERLRDDWHIPETRTQTILNAVDMTRVPRRGPLPARPQRALIFSHHASAATHEPVVREACAHRGIQVEVIGTASGRPTQTPERELGRYDLVFGKARCALEALASGAAVLLCDVAGLGPLVTTAELARLRQWNFGARLLDRPLDVVSLLREIDRYDAADAAQVTDTIRDQASLPHALDEYERVYEQVMSGAIAQDAQPLHALVEPLLVRVAQLEKRIAAYQHPDRMLELSEDALAGLRLTMEEAPGVLTAGTDAFVRVRVHNDTKVRLGPWPPYPLTWVARWRKASAGHFPVHVGEHVLLNQAVHADAHVSRTVAIQAPTEPGRYVLRITLVQESLRWLDSLPTPIAADTEVEVTASIPIQSFPAASSSNREPDPTRPEATESARGSRR